jgi:hypothetical protein
VLGGTGGDLVAGEILGLAECRCCARSGRRGGCERRRGPRRCGRAGSGARGARRGGALRRGERRRRERWREERGASPPGAISAEESRDTSVTRSVSGMRSPARTIRAWCASTSTGARGASARGASRARRVVSTKRAPLPPIARGYLERGLEPGLERGLEPGLENGLRAAVIALARTKLEALSDDDQAAIEAVSDQRVLTKLVTSLGRASSILEARAHTGPRARPIGALDARAGEAAPACGTRTLDFVPGSRATVSDPSLMDARADVHARFAWRGSPPRVDCWRGGPPPACRARAR